MAMLKTVASKIKHFTKETITSAKNFCVKCGNILSDKDLECTCGSIEDKPRAESNRTNNKLSKS